MEEKDFIRYLLLEIRSKTNVSYSDALIEIKKFQKTKKYYESMKKWIDINKHKYKKNKSTVHHISDCLKNF